jgi:hypothetical protein
MNSSECSPDCFNTLHELKLAPGARNFIGYFAKPQNMGVNRYSSNPAVGVGYVHNPFVMQMSRIPKLFISVQKHLLVHGRFAESKSSFHTLAALDNRLLWAAKKVEPAFLPR